MENKSENNISKTGAENQSNKKKYIKIIGIIVAVLLVFSFIIGDDEPDDTPNGSGDSGKETSTNKEDTTENSNYLTKIKLNDYWAFAYGVETKKEQGMKGVLKAGTYKATEIDYKDADDNDVMTWSLYKYNTYYNPNDYDVTKFGQMLQGVGAEWISVIYENSETFELKKGEYFYIDSTANKNRFSGTLVIELVE